MCNAMTTPILTKRAPDPVARFVLQKSRPRASNGLTLVSLFSGSGLSDTGYLAAGYDIVVQAELLDNRAEVGRANFPDAEWIVGDVRKTVDRVVSTYGSQTNQRLSLLVATPPCQGLSSSNPSRGKRATSDSRRHAKKNALLLQIIRAARELEPRAIIAENVRQILTHAVYWNGTKRTVVEVLERELDEYEFWHMPVDVADYGIPQSRTRAVIVGIHRNERCHPALLETQLAPIPAPSHAQTGRDGYKAWVTIRQWCQRMGYTELDASCEETSKSDDPLHCVPWYNSERYRLIADIPAHSGQSAYDNDTCPNCNRSVGSGARATCPHCQRTLWNRPIVRGRGRPRLIKGFASSYRRMRSDRPAAVITTNSSHIGSDWKIHPYENRVLSARECADLQTVPRWYDWTVALTRRQKYLIRNLIGEALPPYFTCLHGRVIASLLRTGKPQSHRLLSTYD